MYNQTPFPLRVAAKRLPFFNYGRIGQAVDIAPHSVGAVSSEVPTIQVAGGGAVHGVSDLTLDGIYIAVNLPGKGFTDLVEKIIPGSRLEKIEGGKTQGDHAFIFHFSPLTGDRNVSVVVGLEPIMEAVDSHGKSVPLGLSGDVKYVLDKFKFFIVHAPTNDVYSSSPANDIDLP